MREVLEEGRSLDSYELGAPQAVFTLLGGWHGPEDWPPPVRWSKRNAGLIMNAHGQGALAIRLCTHAPRLDTEPVTGRVLVNGQEIGEFSLDSADWRDLVFELPADLRQGRLEIEINLERVFIPQNEGMGEDARVLGIAVHQVELMKRQPAKKRFFRSLMGRA